MQLHCNTLDYINGEQKYKTCDAQKCHKLALMELNENIHILWCKIIGKQNKCK